MNEKNEVEDVVDVPEVTPELDDQGNDTTDWKAIAEANRELALKNQGIAKRFKTKLEKMKDEPKANPIEKKEPMVEPKGEIKSDDLDFGAKAFLRSYDIKGADEIALVKNWIKRTGDSLDVAVEDEILQAKLSSLREARKSIEAIPRGSKRTSQAPQNDEEYWTRKIDSGESKLMDIPDINIRRKVLNAIIEKEKTGNKFSSEPIKM